MALLAAFLIAVRPPLPTSPVKIVLGAAVSVYQKTLSSLQGGACNFSPSCSHFGNEAIAKYGAPSGTLMAADRLMRCNPWAPYYLGRYYHGIRNNRIYDPIDNNYIFGPIKEYDDTREIP